MKLEQKSVCRIFLVLLSLILALALVLSSSSFFQQDLFVSQQLSKQRREQQQHLNISSLIDDTSSSSSSSSSSLYQEQDRKFPSPNKSCSCDENKTQQQQTHQPQKSCVNSTIIKTIIITAPPTTTCPTTEKPQKEKTITYIFPPGFPAKIDVADFPLSSSSTSSSSKKNPISGSDLIDLINKNLFAKNIIIQQQRNNSSSSSSSLPWLPFEATSCLKKSTMICSTMTPGGGPLPEYEKFRREEHCCAFADKGKFSVPFSRDAFQVLAKNLVDTPASTSGNNNNNSNDAKSIPPLSSSTTSQKTIEKNSNNNKNKKRINPKKILGRMFPVSENELEQQKLHQLLSTMGKTSDSQNLLEEILSSVSEQKTSLKDATLSLLLGISQLKPVDIEVIHKKNKTNSIQKAPRVFLFGNSYVRALIADIAALFRGQERFFDRGTHMCVRYTVTTHGDYYYIAESMTYENSPDSATSTLPLLEKISLEHGVEEEVILFDIVYQFTCCTFHHGAKNDMIFHPNLFKRFLLFRGSFSAIFMRFFLVREFLQWYQIHGDAGLKNYGKYHMEEFMNSSTEISKEQEEDYLVTLHVAPVAQYDFNELLNSSFVKHYSDYLVKFGKRAFENERDRHPTSSRHTMIFPPPATSFDTVDGKHSQCILLDHFPFTLNRLRTQDDNVEKCADLLSRNFWMKFGISSFLTAKSTREYFRKLL